MVYLVETIQVETNSILRIYMLIKELMMESQKNIDARNV